MSDQDTQKDTASKPESVLENFLYDTYNPQKVESLRRQLQRTFFDADNNNFNNQFANTATNFYQKQKSKLSKKLDAEYRQSQTADPEKLAIKYSNALHNLRRSTLHLYGSAIMREKYKVAPLLKYFFVWLEHGYVSKDLKDAILPMLQKIDSGIKDVYSTVVSQSSSSQIDSIPISMGKMSELNEIYDSIARKISFSEGKPMTILDVVSDRQFQWMYFIKFSRFFFIWLSLYFAEKIFFQWYTRKVYVSNEDPPNLLAFIGIFLALDVSFNIMLFVALFIIKYLFESDDSFFFVDGYFLQKFAVDYIASTIAIFAFTAIIAAVIQRKKYFRYKIEGARAMRALKEMMLGVIALLLVFPYFLMV